MGIISYIRRAEKEQSEIKKTYKNEILKGDEYTS